MVTSGARITQMRPEIKSMMRTTTAASSHDATSSTKVTHVLCLNCLPTPSTNVHIISTSTRPSPGITSATHATYQSPHHHGQGPIPRRVDDRHLRVEAAPAIPRARAEREVRRQVRSQLPLRKGQVPAEQAGAIRQQAMPLHHLPDAARCVPRTQNTQGARPLTRTSRALPMGRHLPQRRHQLRQRPPRPRVVRPDGEVHRAQAAVQGALRLLPLAHHGRGPQHDPALPLAHPPQDRRG